MGWNKAGEWNEYTLNVPTSGTYQLVASVASDGVGGTFAASVDGVAKGGTVQVPNTGDFTIYQQVTSATFTLAAGSNRVLRLTSTANDPTTYWVGDVDWIKLVRVGDAGASISGKVAIAAGDQPAGQPASGPDFDYFKTVRNTDFTSAAYGGIRDSGTGSLTLSGVTGTVTAAYLYWNGPTDSTDSNANAAVNFAGHAIVGTNIGFSSDNAWGEDNSQSYRSDVTSLVSGNGSYSLSNFVKGTTNINGVSLIVFYQDGNASNNRDVILYNGNDSNYSNSYDADGWSLDFDGIDYSGGQASLELDVSDGQYGDGYADGAVTINGQTLTPDGQVFSGDSVPNGPSGWGGLWDQKTFSLNPFLLTGQNGIHVRSSYLEDCLSVVVAAVNLPAGTAPTVPSWTVFLDQNANGALDAGEQSTNADADGNYQFTSLQPGTYSVAEVPVSGWNIISPSPREWTVTVAGGEDKANVNFVNKRVTTQPLATPVVSIEATDPIATEAGLTNAQFTLTRTGPLGQPLTVSYAVDASSTATPGSDFVPLSGTVTFAANAATAVIDLVPLQDTQHEGDESVVIDLLNPPSGSGYLIGDSASATATIVDDDAAMLPAASIGVSTTSIHESDAGVATFMVTLDDAEGITSPITVNLDWSDSTGVASDYTLQNPAVSSLPSSVTFPLPASGVFDAGPQSVSFSVKAVDDGVADGDKTLSVSVANGGGSYTQGTPASAAILIVDDGTSTPSNPTTGPSDTLGFYAFPSSGNEVDLFWINNSTSSWDLYRSTTKNFTPGPTSRIATGLTENSYYDNAVASSTVYYYELSQNPNDGSQSLLSHQEYVKTFDESPLLSAAAIATGDKAFWVDHAIQSAGLTLANWKPETGLYEGVNRNNSRAIYRYYKSMYSADPRMEWMGMAAMVGDQVEKGLQRLHDGTGFVEAGANLQSLYHFFNHPLTPPQEDTKARAIATYARKLEGIFLEMQKAIFDDLGWKFEAYHVGGINEIKRLSDAGVLTTGDLYNFRLMDNADMNFNGYDDVWVATEAVAKYEQKDILGPYYKRIEDMTDAAPLLTFMSDNPFADVGGQSFSQRYSYLAPLVYLGTGVCDFDARWAWVQQDMIPPWKAVSGFTRAQVLTGKLL